jgi:hypothetical protein
MSMTNQATIEQAAKELKDALIPGAHDSARGRIIEILRRHFSAPSEPEFPHDFAQDKETAEVVTYLRVDELRGLEKPLFVLVWAAKEKRLHTWHVDAFRQRFTVLPPSIAPRDRFDEQADAVCDAIGANLMKAAPSEPSDELPMVKGYSPVISYIGIGNRCWAIFDRTGSARLTYNGNWVSSHAVPDWNDDRSRWPDRSSAIAFLHECAAQAANPRPGKVLCPSCHGRTIPGDGTWGCDTCQGEGEIDEPDPGHHPETLIADAQRRAAQASEPQQAGERASLNLDNDEARALHRIVRAMHDGECPKMS